MPGSKAVESTQHRLIPYAGTLPLASLMEQLLRTIHALEHDHGVHIRIDFADEASRAHALSFLEERNAAA